MDQVEEIKNRLDIVEVVREYLPQMKQSGSNWKVLCPFHNEKTPSFMVSKDKQIYHCFGCGEGGDVFEFIKKIENVDFPEALRILAQKTGVVLKRQDPKLLDLKARLIDLHQAATKFFMAHLWQTDSGKAALEYLRGRGLKDGTIKDWKIGWAPDSYEALFNHLQKKGFSEYEIKQSGLVGLNDKGKIYDRFRERIMFPLFDNHGQVIGFTGRLLEEKSGQGKYINSPQTPIYNKSYVLYGLYQAKDAIKNIGQAVLVEGQMDVVTAHQSGFSNVIASSGTALTSAQLDLLKRYTNEIVMAFDSDQAGEKAIVRSTELALRLAFDIKVLLLPAGDDPDSLIKQRPAIWQDLISRAPDLIQYFFDKVARDYNMDNLSGKKQAAQVILNLISKLPNPIDRDFYVKKLSDSLAISESALRENLSLYSAVSKGPEEQSFLNKAEISHWQRMSQRLLAWLLGREDFWPRMVDKILPEMLDGPEERELYSKLIVYYTENKSVWEKELLAVGKLLSVLELTTSEERLLKNLSLLADDLQQLNHDKDIDNDWQLLMKNIQKNFFHQRISKLQKQLKTAETTRAGTQTEDLTAEINQLISNLAKLN